MHTLAYVYGTIYVIKSIKVDNLHDNIQAELFCGQHLTQNSKFRWTESIWQVNALMI